MLKRLRRIVLALLVLIAAAILGPLAYIEGTCQPATQAEASATAAIALPPIGEKGYRRPLDNTYFTFPEWYIVYSFEDFGRFLDQSSESHFGYLRHILGFWQSFCTINRAVPASAESRFDVKMMIYVIGISYSAEYAIKGLYENTIGRVFEWIRGEKLTPQDEYARAVLQDYAAFLYTIPWYKYPFSDTLNGLAAISAPTPSNLRTWERDFALGTEYFIKIGYAAAIQKALDASDDDEPRDIMFVVATLPQDVLGAEPRITPVRTLSPDWQLVQAPRYKALSEILNKLLDGGHRLVEIAGNHEILITVIAPKGTALDIPDTTELFSLDLDAKPGFRRAGLKARIDRLVEIKRELTTKGASLEHFYDY
ncbi:hypothetical protein NLM33_12310 [Bradyrhizobium sp. CCGUVB1N3]|uniref:hypothetical protein n=1 Tax=Bradyrhizobium sp. CCGUVB1N3 TaxID=2949629 RepID=UPI0020B1B70D|nr:hypothetical protein [Bradyrhizobium sp. CCGUVB1N3]MCP3471110.1 hypothetical protein [Bradyrhizobium sp. CCGUVB1N3]